jgi:hypothetical protein
MANLLPQKAKYHSGRAIDGKVDNAWSTEGISKLKARFYCKTCNNEWMSRIESAAKPILKQMIERPNIPRTLNREEQTTLATWAFLRDLVVDGMKSDGFFGSEDFAKFARSKRPLPNTHVWLALLPRSELKGPSAHSENIRSDDRAVGLQVFNFFFSQVAFQVLHRVNKRGAITRRFGQNAGRWRQSAIRIWPSPRPSVAWPPSTLSVEMVDAFRYRFVPKIDDN